MKGVAEFIKSYGKTIFLTLAVVVCCLMGLSSQQKRTDDESMRVLKESLYRATIQCYAIESQYPPDIKYLETNYGVNIDWNRFQVFFTGIGSNIMPDIEVISLN